MSPKYCIYESAHARLDFQDTPESVWLIDDCGDASANAFMTGVAEGVEYDRIVIHFDTFMFLLLLADQHITGDLLIEKDIEEDVLIEIDYLGLGEQFTFNGSSVSVAADGLSLGTASPEPRTPSLLPAAMA